MNSLNVRAGDTVIVITGKDKGKKGKVLECNPSTGRVMVDGTKAYKKHKKPKNAQDKAGIIKITGTMDVSNVMVICSKCGKPTRVGHAYDANGKKYRVCKNAECGASLDKGKAAMKKKKNEEALDAADEKVKKTAKQSNTESAAVAKTGKQAETKAAKPAVKAGTGSKETKPATQTTPKAKTIEKNTTKKETDK